MSNNHLDAVWSTMTAADRFVLLGHERDHLDDDDRARLTSLLAETGHRRAANAAARPVRHAKSTATGRVRRQGRSPARSPR